MLCAVVAFAVSFLSGMYATNESNRPREREGFVYIMAVVFGFTAIGCGLIGIIRFVKWVWGG